ncbi:MAG: type II toxin-antitoxin system RelE/ParE family toxin [Hormoscilla sp. SP12CHS1]|nr:type II toxin-antitoxin system RelE/ParE family toxin [Hormoscilla sp. SP12CHS1]
MSNFCVFTVLAREDINKINDYIAEKNPEAADRFVDRIYEKCQLLAKFPGLGRKRDDLAPELRSFPVEDYLIFYRPVAGGIQIMRVVSGYRDLEDIFSRGYIRR